MIRPTLLLVLSIAVSPPAIAEDKWDASTVEGVCSMIPLYISLLAESFDLGEDIDDEKWIDKLGEARTHSDPEVFKKEVTFSAMGIGLLGAVSSTERLVKHCADWPIDKQTFLENAAKVESALK